MNNNVKYSGLEIAIVGISLRTAGAKNWRQFWNNIVDGVESIKVDTNSLLTHDENSKARKQFINSSSEIDDKQFFDYAFFGYTKDEAGILNPEHRIFHESVWEALEDAGYNPANSASRIGLFAGAGHDLQWQIYSMLKNSNRNVDSFALGQLNNKDFLTTLVSYKLDLRGPSVSVNSACSTSLVAIHLACKSLLLGESRMIAAGGITLGLGKNKGYHHTDGSVNSSDGHCRPFDKDATGTVPADGVGVVILKRLKDAIADNDHIYAIIKGSAINNDGNQKVGYTAPSVDGQASCIKMAQAFSHVTAESIGYVETHGTGTKLGDPIEIEALNSAFGGNRTKTCAIGSLKANIGHTDTAAGVLGLIKTALSLKFKKIPPSINFHEPNPEIKFDEGPFYVNTTLKEWESNLIFPRRAGVSSLGIGGTNAHIVLEEFHRDTELETEQSNEVLLLSAKSAATLRLLKNHFTSFLETENTNLKDMAFTSQAGRKHHLYRSAIPYDGKDELITKLQDNNDRSIVKANSVNRDIVFVFPGVGSQYAQMGTGLYQRYPYFRNEMDQGFSLFTQITGKDYREKFLSEVSETEINAMIYTQPILFVFEYALARFIMHLGIQPTYLLGHSLGEYAAAAISGIVSYEDGLRMAIARGELMNILPDGAMVSVALAPEHASEFISDDVSLAAVNGPQQVVFSGSKHSIDDLSKRLEGKGLMFTRLHGNLAGHSNLIDRILDPFAKAIAQIKFNPPKIKIVSNLNGQFLDDRNAVSVNYWVKQMRDTVKFRQGLALLDDQSGDKVYLEIGGSNALTLLIRQRYGLTSNTTSTNLIRHPRETLSDVKFLNDRLADLWKGGLDVMWEKLHNVDERTRISMPVYPFTKVKFPTEVNMDALVGEHIIHKGHSTNIKDWFYRSQWKQSDRLLDSLIMPGLVLVFVQDKMAGNLIIDRLNLSQIRCITVVASDSFLEVDQNTIRVNPAREQDFQKLFQLLSSRGIVPDVIIHAWNAEPTEEKPLSELIDHYYHLGYGGLLKMIRSWTSLPSSPHKKLFVIASGIFNIHGEEQIDPLKAPLLGALKVVPKEFPEIACRFIETNRVTSQSMSEILKELKYKTIDSEIALRGSKRYVKTFEKVEFEIPAQINVLRQGGTYLITGVGGMAILFATWLAKKYQANIILVGRNEIPEQQIDALIQFGASVEFVRADLGNLNDLQVGIGRAEKRFGAIHGVIQTAGLTDQEGVIINRREEYDRLILSPKVTGTEFLKSIIGHYHLDFFLLCSSLSATLAPFGEVAYVAANTYLDTVAQARQTGYPVISVEWNTLREVGAAMKSIHHLPVKQQNKILENSVSPDEAIKVLELAIYLSIPTVMISSVNPAQWGFNQLEIQGEEEIENDYPDVQRHGLKNNYVSPASPLESRLAAILSGVLGVNDIGVTDNFFDLGGDSLKAMVFLKRIEKEYSANLTLRDFFENQSIRAIAESIEEQKWLSSSKPARFVSNI